MMKNMLIYTVFFLCQAILSYHNTVCGRYGWCMNHLQDITLVTLATLQIDNKKKKNKAPSAMNTKINAVVQKKLKLILQNIVTTYKLRTIWKPYSLLVCAFQKLQKLLVPTVFPS